MNSSSTREVSVRLGAESGEPLTGALKLWHLSEPARVDEAGTLATAVFDFRRPSDLKLAGGDVWLFIHVGGECVDERRFSLLREWNGDFDTQSLLLGADSLEIWRQVYLLRMVAGWENMSASFLKTDVQRWAWIRAASAYSTVLTPWIWNNVESQVPAFYRPVPGHFGVALEPKMFRSRSVFFSQFGEQLLGPAGYVGQDLDGFAELMRHISHNVQRIEVSIVDADRCQQAVSEQIGWPDFFGQVIGIVNEYCDMGSQ